jgi:hypothetical protein
MNKEKLIAPALYKVPNLVVYLKKRRILYLVKELSPDKKRM